MQQLRGQTAHRKILLVHVSDENDFFTYVVLFVVINHYTDHRGGIFYFEPKQCRNVI